MKVSVCVPVYNGAESIAGLVDSVLLVMRPVAFEIVLVNDGSRDGSDKVCRELARKHAEVSYIELRKNVGEHNAVMCALNHARGEFVAIIDDDFQNPPEEILKLVQTAEDGGFDVVYSRYEQKMHGFLRNLGSRFNGLVATWLLEKPSDLYLSSFKVIRGEVVREIILYKGPFPYIDGLILRVTRNIGTVLVRHEARKVGQSNYTFGKLVSLWLNVFVNFSAKPLRLFTMSGFAIALLSAALIVYFVAMKFLEPEQNYGWTSIMVATTFFAGIQMLFLGLIAEYVGKSYLTSTQTPQWTIKSIVTGDA